MRLFIVGAARCGTSSLFQHLARHPAIDASTVKEPHHYGRVLDAAHDDGAEAVDEAEAAYHGLWSGAGIPMEASATYWWHPRAPDRIRENHPDARILVMLRDPVERAYSHWRNQVREGRESLPFLDACRLDIERIAGDVHARERYVDIGRYSHHLHAWQGLPVHVELMEDLRDQPGATLTRVADFLDIDPEPFANMDIHRVHNRANRPRNRLVAALAGNRAARAVFGRLPARLRAPVRDRLLVADQAEAIPDEAVVELAAYYAPHTMELERILGRRVSNRWPRVGQGL